MRVQAHVIIEGIVQGVGFRYAASDMAESLGITGWVRNTGRSVEAVFEGEKEDVDRMVSWCNEGPPSARVTKVEVSYKPAGGEFTEFQIAL